MKTNFKDKELNVHIKDIVDLEDKDSPSIPPSKIEEISVTLPQIADPKKMQRDQFINPPVNPNLYTPDPDFPDLLHMQEVPPEYCLAPALVPNTVQPVLNQNSDMDPRSVIQRWFGNPFKKQMVSVRQIVRHGNFFLILKFFFFKNNYYLFKKFQGNSATPVQQAFVCLFIS